MKSWGLVQLWCSWLLLCSLSSAWPWPMSGETRVRRQNDGAGGASSDKASPSSTASSVTASKTDSSRLGSASTSTAKSSSGSSSGGGSSASSTGTPTSSGSASGSGSGSSSSSASGSDSKSRNSTVTSTTDIDARLPAGGIQMITPAPISGRQYYKIGDFVTFAWNYTSLSVTPSAINVMASCSLNSHLYTIAMNESVQSTQAVTWDTGAEATASAPLPMDTYTLIIYDAGQAISAVPSPGYLGSFNQFQFGMYSPKAPTPANDYKCASCSGAMSSNMERQALGFLFGMVSVTVLSFTWFLAGTGLW